MAEIVPTIGGNIDLQQLHQSDLALCISQTVSGEMVDGPCLAFRPIRNVEPWYASSAMSDQKAPSA